MRLKLLRRFARGILLSACAVFAAPVSAQPALDLVVMVKAGHGPGTRTESGAGLIVSQTKARTVLVTALHVVRDREQVNATELQVEFNMLRGRSFPASLSTAYVDEALDLVVLFVDHTIVQGVPRLSDKTIAESVSPSSPAELIGARVQYVGAARGPWSSGPPGDTVSRSTDAMLRIQSTQARAGASGGGVFDSFGRLLGMISFIDSSSGELVVVPMSRIQQRLSGWRIEFNLGTAKVPTGSPELLEMLRGTTSVSVSFTTGKPHNITVMVDAPDQIKRLSPTFRLIFPDSLTVEPLLIVGPDFQALANLPTVSLRAELWMDTPDGRKTGPVAHQFELEQLALAAALAAIQVPDGGATINQVNEYRSKVEFAKARVKNHVNSYVTQEEVARQTNARVAETQALFDVQSARIAENDLRRVVPDRFSSWSIRCDGFKERWTCYPSVLVGRRPPSGRVDKIVHAIRIGDSATRLTIQVPVDGSAEIEIFIKQQAEQLLRDGADSIHGEVALADGRRLGPKTLCKVDPSTIVRRRICLPP